MTTTANSHNSSLIWWWYFDQANRKHTPFGCSVAHRWRLRAVNINYGSITTKFTQHRYLLWDFGCFCKAIRAHILIANQSLHELSIHWMLAETTTTMALNMWMYVCVVRAGHVNYFEILSVGRRSSRSEDRVIWGWHIFIHWIIKTPSWLCASCSEMAEVFRILFPSLSFAANMRKHVLIVFVALHHY